MKIIRLIMFTFFITTALLASYEYKKPVIDAWIQKEIRSMKIIQFRIHYKDILDI